MHNGNEDGPDGTAVDVDDALETHADAEDGDFAGKVANGIARDARVGGGMTRTGGDDETLYVELGQRCGGDRIVANDGHVGAEETELLIEIPRERVEIVDEQTIDGLCEGGWERHGDAAVEGMTRVIKSVAD